MTTSRIYHRTISSAVFVFAKQLTSIPRAITLDASLCMLHLQQIYSVHSVRRCTSCTDLSWSTVGNRNFVIMLILLNNVTFSGWIVIVSWSVKFKSLVLINVASWEWIIIVFLGAWKLDQIIYQTCLNIKLHQFWRTRGEGVLEIIFEYSCIVIVGQKF